MKKLLKIVLLIAICLQHLHARAEGLTVFSDLLVWHASQETSSTWASVISGSTRSLEFDATNINFHWHPGIRSGFFYTSDCNSWESGLAWTYYSASTKTGFSVGDQIVLPEFFSGFISGNFFFGANIRWQLMMNMADMEVGRKLNIGESLTLRPKFGIKAGTIRQKIHCEWDARIYTATEELRHNFSGAGPSFGIDGKWNVCDNFSFFGDFSTAFMAGNWKVTDTYTRPSALGGLITPTVITTSLNNSKLGTPMFRCLMGLEWIFPTICPLTFKLGYEMQFWPNQLRLPTFQQLPLRGGLTLQGGTCQVRIDF